MCLFSLHNTHRIPRSILHKLQCVLQRQSLFSCRQQLKDLKKDELDHYMSVRSACVHYIRACHTHFRSKPDTFVTAVTILDVFLWKVKVTHKHMSIVSAACYFVAAKMLESDEVCPSAKQLAGLHEWTSKDLQRMEVHILAKLGWHVTTVSYLDYLPLFAVVYGVNMNLVYSHKMMVLAEKCVSHQSTVLVQPAALALALLQHVTQTKEDQCTLDSQVLVHCNIQESDLYQSKQFLSSISSSSHAIPIPAATRPKFPLKVFDKPSEMGVTCLPTIVEEAVA